MSRNRKPPEKNEKMARTLRAAALRRIEMGFATSPRVPASGVTSAAIKAEDPVLRAIIDAAVRKKKSP